MKSEPAKNHDLPSLVLRADRFFQHLVESVRCGVFVADTNENIIYVNKTFAEILGYGHKDELAGLNIAQDIFVDRKERKKFFAALKAEGYVKEFEIQARRKGGAVATLCLTTNHVRDEQGTIVGVEGIAHDITERKRLEQKLKDERKKMQEILSFDQRVSAIHRVETLMDFVVEKSTEILRAKRCSLMLVDDTNQDLCIKAAKGLDQDIVKMTRVKMGEPVAGLVAQEGGQWLVEDVERDSRTARKNRAAYRHRSFISTAIKVGNRSIGVVNLSEKDDALSPDFDQMDLMILNAIVRQAAVSIENANLFKELKYLSTTDPITNLANYRCFVNGVQDEINRFHRFSEPFSLLMVDVDNFKVYNDTYGHLEGDVLLKTLGEVMTTNLRIIDKVYRYGGDEFLVLLPGTKSEQAQIVADKLRVAIEHYPFRSKNTVSIGVVEYRKRLSRFDLTLSVDQALYQAKHAGRNQVQVLG